MKQFPKSLGKENVEDVKSKVPSKRLLTSLEDTGSRLTVKVVNYYGQVFCRSMWTICYFVAEDCVIDAATAAIEKAWAISAVEKTGEGTVVKYCGFEIEAMDEGGFKISQNKYELEMLQRWNVTKAIEYPNFRTTEEDEGTPTEPIDPQQIKQAQAMAGALLWLSTQLDRICRSEWPLFAEWLLGYSKSSTSH